MNNNLLLISSAAKEKNAYSFDILDTIRVSAEIQINPYAIRLQNLFGMAARINKKRAFLFVSKVLGKHLPVQPSLSLLTGAALSARYMEMVCLQSHPFKKEIIAAMQAGACDKQTLDMVTDFSFTLSRETLFIGFAETATALGHSVFNCFKNATFLHTTREAVDGLEPVITFEEEHSHAVSHRVYVDNQYLNNTNPVVLVDDEITTGKTTLNIIESIQSRYPRKEYAIVSILDWRSPEEKEQFKVMESRLGITIHAVSLIAGTIQAEGQPVTEAAYEVPTHSHNATVEHVDINSLSVPMVAYTALPMENGAASSRYIAYTGRFGLSSNQKEEVDAFISKAGQLLAEKRKGKKTLCLGTGEFMYVPMRIAAEMGEGVAYQSTTRSPIYSCEANHYVIKQLFSYECPEDHTITNYFYNVLPDMYDEVFLFLERELPETKIRSIIDRLSQTISHIHVVSFGKNKESEGE